MKREDLPGTGGPNTKNGKEERWPASGRTRRREITTVKVAAAMVAAQAAFAGYAAAQDECPPDICEPPCPPIACEPPSPCPPVICQPPSPPPPPDAGGDGGGGGDRDGGRRGDGRGGDGGRGGGAIEVTQESEQEADSGDIDQSFNVTGGGDNSNQTAGIAGTANTGNVQNSTSITQIGSEADDFEVDDTGASIEIDGSSSVSSNQRVNQSATTKS